MRWMPFGVVCLLFGAVCTAAAPAQDRPKGEFPVQAAFVPLAPGAVEPEGWLRDWAMAARDGITGHLDEYHPTFRDAWTDLNLDARTATFQKIIGPLEQGAYWLDGLLRLGYLLHDEHLIHKAEAHLKPVVEGVNHGADSFIYYWKLSEGQAVLPDNIDWQTKQRLPMLPSWMKLQTMRPTWFGWAQSHMGRALVAWYQATGDNRILDALVRAYAGHPLPMGRLRFDAGDTYIVSGLCNIDAMLETYRLSADRRILERVRTAMGDANVQAALREWRDGRFLPGHAVCALEQIRLPALFYLATGRQECLEASRQAFRWVEANHLLPYGVSSGEEFFSGIGAFRCTETCNIVAQIWSSLWLYRVCGERSFGDRIERAFFNAGPACVARDFQTMCYYQSPNRIQCGSLPDDQPASPGTGCHLFTRLGYPPVLCCVGAVNRLVPNYVMHLWMATPDQGLAATLYGPCKVSAAVGANTHVKLVCQTAYPFEETVRVTVEPDQPASFPLYFRIPGWCAKPRITVNQGVVPALADANGFVRIQRPWAKGNSVVLEFPMSVRLTRGFETEYPPLNQRVLQLQTPHRVREAAIALRVHFLRAAVVRPGDPRQGSQHAGSGPPMEVRAGQPSPAWRGRHQGAAAAHAGEMGLAACRPIGAGSSREVFQLATDRRPGTARRPGRRRPGRIHLPDSLRLHQVPHLHVPGDAAILAAAARPRTRQQIGR